MDASICDQREARPIRWCPEEEIYYMDVDGDEVLCTNPLRLADILRRLDEREARREDTRSTVTAFWLAAGLAIVAALLSRYF